ncbi:OsmC family protein [Arthrobacter sp. VKM Ac-2550]|uniref:OsmC family protein n=1 Tax=Crystallibacter permensis TaxID=1938888 RepID=UPI002227A06A|nr:OsmC family protein [Arthrobacter sp. VKM Ac-2550]MCW2135417.1 putative OsmC-related protein [Arthrobacter sp. VKM Ac-2550]
MTTSTASINGSDAGPENESGPSLKTIRATGDWKGSMVTEVHTRGFTFRTDEPKQIGGTDLDPTPMQYVVGAVNGCVTVVIEAVAAEIGAVVKAIRTSSQARQDVRGFRGTADVSPHFNDFLLSIEIDFALAPSEPGAFREQVEKRCPAINLLRDAGVQLDIEWHINSLETKS